MTEIQTEYRPMSVSPPGASLADILEERGMTQAQLATRMGRPKPMVNQLIRGKIELTDQTALQLEKVLSTPASFWLRRERTYREHLARKAQLEGLKAQVDWVSELPFADMVKFGWVEKGKTRPEKVDACLRFFGVASVPAWREAYERTVVAWRTSSALAKKPGAVAAWLRRGEIEAAEIETQPFDKAGLRDAIPAMRGLATSSEPDLFVPKLREICARRGVAVVFIPAPKGCPAFGATHWPSPTKAIIQLSLRYKTEDFMWFTFFHELCHVIRHNKTLFLEGGNGCNAEEEQEAEAFARNTLIPPNERGSFNALSTDAGEITRFAARLGISPGVVVGRMQRENKIPWSHPLGRLKVKYRWNHEAE